MSDYSFFFQAEDGIRDTSVTGVQTCALPISCDLVLIALKATNNEALLQLIPALLHQRTILLTLQNGLGNEDFLAQHFGDDRVMGGLCFICLNRIYPGLIEHLDYGNLTIGEFSGSQRSSSRAVA